MMKKRFVSFLLMMLLMLTGLMTPTQATGLGKQDVYTILLSELEYYLNDMECMPMEELFLKFSELGRYEMSAQLAVYTDILSDLEQDDYGRIFLYLDVLKMNGEFCAYLEKNEHLGTITELENYARGRQAELNGDGELAYTYYAQCMSFMDSTSRMLAYRSSDMEAQYQQAYEYYKQGTLEGYQQAYDIFSELAVYDYESSAAMMATAEMFIGILSQATPAPSVGPETTAPVPEVTATPVPEATAAPVSVESLDIRLSVGFSNDTATLSWTEIPGASRYRVYRANGKDEDMRELVVIHETASPRYSDANVHKSIYSTYQVEAVNADGAVVGRSARESVYAVSKSWGSWSSWSTQKVTADSTTKVESKTQYRSRSIKQRQEYTDWSSWSGWSETASDSSSTQEVKTKTQYRYRTSSTTTQTSDWSAWSGWSDSPATSSVLQEVETQTVYPYYYFACPNCGTRRHVWDQCPTWIGGCGRSFSSSSGWVSTWLTTPWSSAMDWHGTGRKYIAGPWFCWTSQKAKTQYRYRTRTQDTVTTWSDWSVWSDSSTDATNTCQVETRTLYSTRTRKLETKTEYGSWSNWGDNYIEETSTRDVETQTVYRYQKYQ